MKIIEISNHHQFDGAEIDRKDFNKLLEVIESYSKYNATVIIENEEGKMEKYFI